MSAAIFVDSMFSTKYYSKIIKIVSTISYFLVIFLVIRWHSKLILLHYLIYGSYITLIRINHSSPPKTQPLYDRLTGTTGGPCLYPSVERAPRLDFSCRFPRTSYSFVTVYKIWVRLIMDMGCASVLWNTILKIRFKNSDNIQAHPLSEMRRRNLDVIFLYKMINSFIKCPAILESINFRVHSGDRSRDIIWPVVYQAWWVRPTVSPQQSTFYSNLWVISQLSYANRCYTIVVLQPHTVY